MQRSRLWACVAVAWLVVGVPVREARACPFHGQRPMLVVQLFFGQSVDGGAVSDQDWTAFVAETVTRHFPAGFTVYDAYGQWMDPAGRIGRERTKVIVVAGASGRMEADVREVVRVYRERFRQQSVGVISGVECAGF